jgi:hypothetical protein
MSALRQEINGAAAPPPAVNHRLAAMRARLAEAGAAVERLGAELTRLNQPVTRLGEITAAAANAEARRGELLACDQVVLGAWLVTGDGPRPEPSAELIEVERLLIAANRDRAAAEAVAPGAAERANRVAPQLRDAGIERDGVLGEVAAEVAFDFVDTALRRKMLEFLTARGVVESLVMALSTGGGAMAADRIRNHLRALLHDGVPHNPVAGRRFITRLYNDPDAELGG